jgi:flagella basal body P-ring formation protein FlgA
MIRGLLAGFAGALARCCVRCCVRIARRVLLLSMTRSAPRFPEHAVRPSQSPLSRLPAQPRSRSFLRVRIALRYCAGTLLALAATVTYAQAPGSLIDIAQTFAQREAATQDAARGARIEVTVAALDGRYNLAPCQRAEPFLPIGARLWGRTQVGVRCVQGATWSVLVPVLVRVYGMALVAAHPLAAAQPLAAEDVQAAEIDLSREPQGVATELAQIEGHTLNRALMAGQAIPVAALRAIQVIGQGDPVKIVGQGRGFAVATDGIALAAAQDGQAVRVRLESGRILTGTARTGRLVELAF